MKVEVTAQQYRHLKILGEKWCGLPGKPVTPDAVVQKLVDLEWRKYYDLYLRPEPEGR